MKNKWKMNWELVGKVALVLFWGLVTWGELLFIVENVKYYGFWHWSSVLSILWAGWAIFSTVRALIRCVRAFSEKENS